MHSPSDADNDVKRDVEFSVGRRSDKKECVNRGMHFKKPAPRARVNACMILGELEVVRVEF
jgi:hypothetical protein